MGRILLVESDPPLAALLEEGFRASGYATSTVADGSSARAVAEGGEYDLVVVDAAPLTVDELATLRTSAERRRVPVVFMTTLAELEGRLKRLGLDTHDHVVKPFHFDVLLAHVQDRLDRERSFPEVRVAAGWLKLDPWTRSVRMDGVDIALTGREFALLEFFLRHPRQVLTRDLLHAHVWSYDHDPSSNVIEVYVGYLRKKLGTEVIETVHGRGYRLKG